MNIEMLGELILEGALKGAGVALVGWLIACRWKRRAAVDRHTLWLLVLASFLILPLMQQWGPQWRILPKVSETVIDEPREVSLGNPSSVIDESSPSESWVPPVASRTSSESAVSMGSSGISSTKKLPWWAMVWMCGAAIVLGRVFVGRIALWVYGRQSENGKIQVFTNELRDRMGMKRRVEIVLSARRKMPMTWGWRRPKILLPAAAESWERDCLEVVLLHELAHVKRHDAATQGLVQLVTAIYWFHPVVWFAVWRLVGERERACDQAVVDEGVKPSNYARHLMAVALADTSPLLCPSAGMGMAARKGELEKRVQTLLETTSRRRMKWRWIVATVGGWLGVVCPLAMLTAQESATGGLEAAPPTLEGDLLAGEEPTDSEAAVPEVTGWQLELRQLTSEERNKLDRGDAVDQYPALQAEFKSIQGAEVYQIRNLRLYVDGVPYRLREAQDWSSVLSPERAPSRHYLSLGLEGWEPLLEAGEKEIEWLPGKLSVQVVFTIESEEGQPSKLSSNVASVDYPDLPRSRGDEKLTDKASEFPEEISRDRYAEAVARLEQLKLSYGVKHPKMIEQQQLVDSLMPQALSTRDASPIMDRQLLKKRYDQEIEKLDELGRKYLHRHPKIIQQKALIGEIVEDIREVQEVVRVASPASGIVSEVRVVRNQDVKKGAVLLTLDGRRARLAVESAKVQLELANRRLDNLTVAFKAGKVVGVDVSEAQAQLQLAETALAVAKIDLEDLSVRAPVDGKVVSVDAKVGEYVSPEKPVVHFRPTSP